MSLPVVMSQQAEADFDAAVDWYEQTAGLGDEFILRIREVLTRISDLPEIYPVVYQTARRALVRQFPYLIFYRIGIGRIEVIAIVDGRSDPSLWRNRV